MSGFPTLLDVDEIVGMPDPVLRNLRITLGYHELAVALAARHCPGANWFCFAVWASRQAGQTIRGEDGWRWLERELMLAPELSSALQALVLAARLLGSRSGLDELRAALGEDLDLEAALRRAADAVARGNAMVFDDVGRAAALFLAETPDAVPNPAGLARWQASLRAGDPPGGQDSLRRAFLRYHRIRLEPDAPLRAEWLLLANLEIGYHEQIRLQPELLKAVNAALPDADVMRTRLLARLFPAGDTWLRARAGFWSLVGRRAPLDRALDALVNAVRRETRRILTRRVMTLDLAGVGAIRLGTDITGELPASLRHVRDPELQALLARIDPTPDSLAATGARDWGSLPERLHFVADLFRRYQETPELLTAPFTPDQVAEVRLGRRPPGRL